MRYRLTLMIALILAFGLNTVLAQDATEEPTEEVVITEEPVEVETEEPTQEVTEDPTEAATEEPAATSEATAVPTTSGDSSIYVVQSGDTLIRIALRFNTTVSAIARENGITNVNLIYAGQRLRIPGAASGTATSVPSTPAPTRTVVPGDTIEHTVRSGETLFRIALRYRTTVARLVELNGISNPNLIFTGQVLRVPAEGAPQPTAASTNTSATTAVTPEATEDEPVTATEEAPDLGELEDPGFAFGVVAFADGDSAAEIAEQAGALGMEWVKVNVRWRDLEPTQGEILFDDLDAVVDALDGANLNILLTVSTSPDWARSSSNPIRLSAQEREQGITLEEEGPPDDFAVFASFVGALAERYAGRVDAYQIWNEPNLAREWNTGEYNISPEPYVALLSEAYTAIKASDPDALVITAGLAPTGYNDGINAIDDRVYLRGMYDNGVVEVSDAIAAHPGGWANPPDAECCDQPAGVETHYENPVFFFKDTLTDYREIMVDNDDERPIWVTKFGWGTGEGGNPPSQEHVFIRYTDLAEQAIYTPRAFELGEELGFVGPMFAYNLNGCTADRPDNPVLACYYSLVAPDDSLRPVFSAVQVLEK